MLTILVDKSVNRDERMIYNTPYMDESWKKSHLGTVRQAYRKSPFYNEVMEFLASLYLKEYGSIGEMNIVLITEICKRLELTHSCILPASCMSTGTRMICWLRSAKN